MDSVSEDILQFNTDVYKLFIVDHVKFSHLLSYVDCMRVHAPRINKLDRDGRYREAGELFLTLLKESDDVGRWQQFRDALQQEEYEHVVKLLSGDIGAENHLEKRKIIELFQQDVAKSIDPIELCNHLKDREVFSDIDEQQIFQLKQNHGDITASLYLLNNIWKKKISWYEEFLTVLIQLRREHVARLIDPDFVDKKQVQNDAACGMIDTRTVEGMLVDDHGEAYLSGNVYDNPPNLDDDNAPNLNDGSISLHTSAKQMEAKKFKLDLNICEPETNQQLNDLTNKIICHPTDDKYMNNTTDSEAHHSDDDNVDNVDSVDNDATEATSDASDDVPAKTLQLRPYQEELATLAVAGKNVIIVAPTGSGKTIVAVKIMQEHLLKRGVGVRKILFLVNQVALAKQQYDACKEYMSDWPLELVSGDTQDTNKVPLKNLLDKNKILFMTAQIILDGLREKEIDSLSAVSLIVFDECHHTKMRHPFNQMMHLYMDLKFGLNAEHVRLPQIVGLTASVGVGKASTLPGAVGHIKNLCANLDAEEIVTVQKTVESLADYAKVAAVDVQTASKRSDDKFHEFIAKKLMQPIEENIQKCGFTDRQIPASLQPKLRAPAKHGSDQYTQWISSLRREVAKIEDQNSQRFFVSCRRYLEVYNDALILNEDCRTIDALHYMDGKFSEIFEHQTRVATKTENELKESYEKHKEYLQRISTLPESRNPKIILLEKMLVEAFRTEPKSRAMVFVKTRAQAIALKDWMKETRGLKELNPGVFTGANTAVDKGGMTKSGQVDVLKYFRDGQHKLIISTSIGEEGLDISACNLVIRYDHVTNEIAMVQARGRARAEDSKFAVIASQEKGSAQKEELNLIREMLMKRAIRKLQEEARNNMEEFNQQLKDIQEQAKVDREIEAATYKGRTLRSEEFELRCFGCDAFACFSTDIKTIQKAHHAIISKDFDDTVTYKPHPKPVTYDEIKKQEKMYCKKCGHDWGISVIYKSAKFPIIKIESFVLVDSIGRRDIVKKWKNAPFATVEINHQDMQSKLSILNDSH